MKLTTSVFSALVALALSAQAATITVTSVADPNNPIPILNPDGVPLASGSGSVGIGTFSDVGQLTELAAQANSGDFSAIAGLQNAFQQFGSSVSMGFNNIDGLYQNTISETVGGTAFSGANVYTVIGNGSNLDGGSVGLMVFEHPFTFVDEPGNTPNASLRLDSGELIVGSREQGPVGAQMFEGFMLAGVVPEPSSAMLGLMGLSFLVLRRRK